MRVKTNEDGSERSLRSIAPPVPAPRRWPRGASWLRLLWRLPLYFGGTLVMTLAWFLTWPLAALIPRLRTRLRRMTMQGWGRWSLWCFAIRLERRGALPQQGVLLVANHTSYIDICVLAASTDAVFVSMRELLRWPFFGTMARALGTVFLDRERKRELVGANREMSEWIGRGYTVVLFPEGENTRGRAVQRFRPALLEAAAAAELPVACATIGYVTLPGDPPASELVAWVETPFLRHALLLATRRRIEARITFHAELERSRDRKLLAERLRARVASAFVPLER